MFSTGRRHPDFAMCAVREMSSSAIFTIEEGGSYPDRASASYAAFEDLPGGVLVVEASGRLLAANAAFLNMVDRQREEILGLPLESIVAAEDMLQFLGVEEMFSVPAVDTNIIFTARDGSPRHLIVCSGKSRDRQTLLLMTRASGAVEAELASTTRWAAAEQERALELGQARDALAEKNAALRVAQAEADLAYTKLQDQVAAREQLEKELRLAQKLEAIGHLAAGIAHEINTPMQYIGDNVAFLGKAFDTLRDYFELVRESVNGQHAGTVSELERSLEAARARLKLEFLLKTAPKAIADSTSGIAHVSNIVRAMKSFAHADQEEMASSDLNAALLDTLVVAQNAYKSVARVETELAQLPPVICYIGRLNQVFLNLIVNAGAAIAEAQRTDGKITIRSRREGGEVLVSICDNGCGIPQDVQHKIFDPFFTTKPVGRGVGQGLSLARDIVAAHRGVIFFESSPGEGSTFTLRLPISHA